MFDNLSDKLDGALKKLSRQKTITEKDLDNSLREIRIALLEADIALPIVKSFIQRIREEAIGQKVIKSVNASQQIIKIVNDTIVELLEDKDAKPLAVERPNSVVMMLGLQGTGKTTTSAKLARLWSQKQNKKVLMASLDVYRPAAQQQLETLGQRVNVDTLEIIDGQKPVDIAKRALKECKRGGYDILILDTAGRLHIDEAMMQELQEVSKVTKPSEKLLVADALTGQDAANMAREFNDKIGVSGIVLTRIDGDGRGGAALSMRQISGAPIRFLSSGEDMNSIEDFDAKRIADRILGMGDIVSLVEKAAEVVDEQEAQDMMMKMMKGNFDLNDMLKQLRNMKKMGGMSSIMKLLPGGKKLASMIDSSKLDDKMFARQEAIILSMTPAERAVPGIIKAGRRKRIAAGSGVTVSDVNKILKQHQQMATMMKKLNKKGGKGMMEQMSQMMGGGGGMPGMPNVGGGGMPDMKDMEMNKQMQEMMGKLGNKFPFKK